MRKGVQPNADPLLPSSTARGLSLAGLVLMILFLTILAGSLFPVRLLDPAWQLRVGGALINASPFPLIGLGLLHLAAALDLHDPLLSMRRRLSAQVAVAVAVGYLLLAPLLGVAALRQQQRQTLEQSTRLRRANAQLEQMRQATSRAASTAELEQRLSALQGPKLDAADRTLRLPLLRSRVNALLDQAVAQVAHAQASRPPLHPWILLPEIARTSIACLALAVGFAGLARRPGSDLSLLQELQDGLDRLWFRQRFQRRNRQTLSDDEYLRQLSGNQED